MVAARAQQRRLVGDPLEIDPTEPAQDQGVRYPLDRLLVAPGVQMLDHQQPQEHLSGRRGSAMDQRQPVALAQIAADLLVELVIVEQVVELDEHRVRLVGQFRHPCKDIFGLVAVDEHSSASHQRRSVPHSTSLQTCRSAGIRPP